MQDFQNENKVNSWSTKGFMAAVILIVAAFLFVPLMTSKFIAYIVLQCFLLFLVLIIMYSINGRWLDVLIELSCIIPFIIFEILSLHQHSLEYMAIAYGFTVAFMLFVICLITKGIIYSPTIDTNLIFGALMVYLLAGLSWAKLYFIVNVIFPGSFHAEIFVNFNEEVFSKAFVWQFNLLYYSFSVLTTLGLGDIIPIHGHAKSLTMMEAMFGQLFVAIIIAKLVGTWRRTLKD